MAAHPSILAWRIPWTEEPGGLPSRGCKDLDTAEGAWHACTQKPPLTWHSLRALALKRRGPTTGESSFLLVLALLLFQLRRLRSLSIQKMIRKTLFQEILSPLHLLPHHPLAPRVMFSLKSSPDPCPNSNSCIFLPSFISRLQKSLRTCLATEPCSETEKGKELSR